MSERRLLSSVRAEDWAPVYNEFWHGLVHSANNRIAALGGILQLYESKISTPGQGMEALRGEVPRLRNLMQQFRALTVSRSERREPVRLRDAMGVVTGLVAHHALARNWSITVTEEPPGLEPVLLWPADALCLPTLMLLAAGGSRNAASVSVSFAQADAMSAAVMVTDQAADVVAASGAFAALARAVAVEHGRLDCVALPPTQAELRLALPGLSLAAQLQA